MQKKVRIILLAVMLFIMILAIGLAIGLQFLHVKKEMVAGVRYSLVFLALALAVVFVVIDWLLKKRVLNGLHQLIRDMENIAKGNLDVFSCVRGNTEFEQLSRGINSMVKSITRTSGMLSRVFEMMDAQFAVFEYNDDSKRVTTTDRLGMMLGISSSELGPMIQDKALFQTRLAWIIKNPIPDEENVYQIDTKGHLRYIRINIATEDGSTFGMVADVTEDMKQKQAIIRERDYDALTQIRNRRSFERDVKKLLSGRNLAECAMIMIDLDKFKGINDTYGHAFGDEYLQRAAAFIERFCERNCIVARRSGDEFYLLVYGCKSKDQIRQMARAYYDMLAKEPIDFPDGSKKSIGMSMGIAWYVPGLKDFDAFLACADDALYEAKEGGRNTFGEKEFQFAT